MIRLMVLLIPLLCCSCQEDSDSSGLAGTYDFSTVDQFIEESAEVYQHQVAVLVSKDGEIIYHKEIDMDVDSKQLIASASKWLSGAVIMALVDEQKLSLDDTVGQFLPLFSKAGKGQITIRQLFSHTAGFEGDLEATGSYGDKYEYRSDMTMAEAVDSIAQYTPLVNAPGTVFSYGSASMQVAGRIAEVVSGMSWQELFDKKIGNPCDMDIVWSRRSQNPIVAGGARANARDYLNFVEMIVNRGMYQGTRVLSEEAVEVMLQDQTRGAEIQGTPYPSNPFSPYPDTEVRYGIGNWADVVDETGQVIENSSPGMFGTHPWQDTKHGIAGIIFTRTEPRLSTTTSLQIRQMIRDIVENAN